MQTKEAERERAESKKQKDEKGDDGGRVWKELPACEGGSGSDNSPVKSIRDVPRSDDGKVVHPHHAHHLPQPALLFEHQQRQHAAYGVKKYKYKYEGQNCLCSSVKVIFGIPRIGQREPLDSADALKRIVVHLDNVLIYEHLKRDEARLRVAHEIVVDALAIVLDRRVLCRGHGTIGGELKRRL